MINLNALGLKDIQRNPAGLKIEMVNIIDLKPNSYNPNKHDIGSMNLLIKSLAMFGFTQPIVVRAETNEIIDGEHRWRCAAILDYEEVPVIYIRLTDTEMRIATIIHNRARGKEDNELLKSIDDYMESQGENTDEILLKNK